MTARSQITSETDMNIEQLYKQTSPTRQTLKLNRLYM